MTDRPLLIDLFCGVGGASVGYHRAGFDVVGVDIAPQPDYPYEFVRANALDVLASIDRGRWRSRAVAAVHASPPCQASCALIKGNQRATAGNHVDLIPRTRELLENVGLPYVIENVQGARMRRDLTLCGEQFGLRVIRHRYFECSFPVDRLAHKPHRGRVAGMRHGVWYEGPYFAVYGEGGGKGTVDQWRDAMGIDWTRVRRSLAEAIPPAYAEYVGAQLLKALEL